AAIRFDEGLFVWCDVFDGGVGGDKVTYQPVAPLFPQPPTPDSLAERTPGTGESESCPFCGQEKRRRRPSASSPQGRRRRKPWTVLAPDDSEDGAEVLDTLVDELAPLLGYHTDDAKRLRQLRYFVLVPTLVYAHHNRADLVEAMKGDE